MLGVFQKVKIKVPQQCSGCQFFSCDALHRKCRSEAVPAGPPPDGQCCSSHCCCSGATGAGAGRQHHPKQRPPGSAGNNAARQTAGCLLKPVLLSVNFLPSWLDRAAHAMCTSAIRIHLSCCCCGRSRFKLLLLRHMHEGFWPYCLPARAVLCSPAPSLHTS